MSIPQAIPAAAFLITLCLGYAAGKCGVSAECSAAETLRPYAFTLFEPLYLYALWVLPSAVAAAFIPYRTFADWLRFAGWWTLLSTIVVAMAPDSSTTWLPLYFIGRDTAAMLLGGLFSVISLLFMTRRWFQELLQA